MFFQNSVLHLNKEWGMDEIIFPVDVIACGGSGFRLQPTGQLKKCFQSELFRPDLGHDVSLDHEFFDSIQGHLRDGEARLY